MGSCDALLSGTFYAHSIFFLISLAICSFFSFLETSVSSIRPYKLKELSRRQGRYSKLLKAMESSPDKVLSVILIAKNVADVMATIVSGYMVDILSAQWQLCESIHFFLSISVATIAILIFGEIIPKSIGKLHGERLFASTLGVINIVFFCLYPLSYLTKVARFLVSRVRGLHVEEDHAEGTEKELQFLIEHSSEKGLMEREKETMLMNILRLDSITVREIMVPQKSFITLRADMELSQVLREGAYHFHAHLLVYEGTPTNLIGIVYQQDLLLRVGSHERVQLSEIMRPLIIVSASMKLNQLLKEFRQQHRHRAAVVDHADRVMGLVHLQDVLEQIVGNIPDEQVPAWSITVHNIHDSSQADARCASSPSITAYENTTSREKKGSTRITGRPD